MNSRDFALYEIDARRLPGWPVDLPAPRREASPGREASPRRAAKGRRPVHGQRPPTDPRDLALAEQIAIGVTKNLLLLRHLIHHYSGRSLKSIDSRVQKILAIGMYQLRFLTRIPASAAVDEAVEQAKRFGRTRAAGFVNAVLRKAAAQPDVPLPSRDTPAEFAAVVLSHPPELFARLQRLVGPEGALKICEHNQLQPPTIVRLAPGVSPGDLAAEGVTLRPHRQAGFLVAEGARRLMLADWAARGLAQVQDPTAAAVIHHAKIEPGQTILDRCCGLGTKTLQARELLGESGEIIAIDPAEPRCAGLRELAARRRIANVSVRCTAWMRDINDDLTLPRDFSCAIVDVPCSNSGVLARRPEARYHQSDQSIRSLAELQDRILDDTAPRIAAGGLLVYSTCSIWPEENQDRVLAFAQRHPDFEVQEVRTTMPSPGDDPAQYHDGGYVAVLRKKNVT